MFTVSDNVLVYRNTLPMLYDGNESHTHIMQTQMVQACHIYCFITATFVLLDTEDASSEGKLQSQPCYATLTT